MATTVTAADLTVTITEGISLNGVEYGNTISTTFATQGKVDQRIMSTATTYTDVIYTAAADGRGQVVAADWGYFRITNLDDTNFITLRLYDATDSQFFKIPAGKSFVLMNPEIDVDASGTTFNSFENITQIAVDADGAACDIEYIMVTAPE